MSRLEELTHRNPSHYSKANHYSQKPSPSRERIEISGENIEHVERIDISKINKSPNPKRPVTGKKSYKTKKSPTLNRPHSSHYGNSNHQTNFINHNNNENNENQISNYSNEGNNKETVINENKLSNSIFNESNLLDTSQTLNFSLSPKKNIILSNQENTLEKKSLKKESPSKKFSNLLQNKSKINKKSLVLESSLDNSLQDNSGLHLLNYGDSSQVSSVHLSSVDISSVVAPTNIIESTPTKNLQQISPPSSSQDENLLITKSIKKRTREGLAISLLKKSQLHKDTTLSQNEILDIIRKKKNPEKSLLDRLRISVEDNSNPNIQSLQSIKKSLQVEDIVKDVHRLKLPSVAHNSIIHFENENQLKVKIITWNLDGSLPKNEEIDNLKTFIEPDVYHIYAIGSQNCEPSKIPFYNQPKLIWENILIDIIGSNYVALASSCLIDIHLIVFVRIDLLPWISNLVTCEIPTGFMNEYGNKGASSISFWVGSTSMIFINTYLPDGETNIKGRSNAFHKIIDLVKYFGKHEGDSIYQDINRIFFFGDLNFRVNGNFGIAENILASGEIHILIQNDQLTLMRAENYCFEQFDEGAITFRPTYMLTRQRNVYEESITGECVPSWTDRILWVPNYENIKLLSYEASFYLRCSTHRPVSARFLMTVDVKKSKPLSESRRAVPLQSYQSCSIQ